MKRVLLFRHGKSDWSADFDHDFDRPLAGRGHKASRRMGKFLSLSGLLPEVVISSTALRARRTIELASSAGEWSIPVTFDDRLYGADEGTVLHLLQHLDEDVERAMIVGHEPTMSDCVGLFTHAAVRFPTAAICCIRFEADDWRTVLPGEGELIWHLPPRILR